MLKKLRFIATLVCLSLSFSTFAEGLVFINDDLRTGLNRAASEGKLIFLEFSASYCSPCKIMDEYTFTNAAVIERMNNGYVPVKVDIQSFEGFDLKNQFKVTLLPTIIIMDSKGRPVARYEETMGATKLSAVLDKHNLPQNRNRVAPLASYNNSGFNPSNKPSSTASSSYNPPPTVPSPAPIRTNNPTNTATPSRKPVATATVAPTAPEVGQRRAIPTTGFTIQAGAYAQVASAQGAVNDLKAKAGNQKTFIMQSNSNGKVTYRIFIGNFTTRQQADEFRKKNAIEGYTRGFGEFVKK